MELTLQILLIKGHTFRDTFKLLKLESNDVILGYDWLYRHSPINLDWKARTMSICHNGQETIILSDSSNTTSPTLLDPAKFQKEIDKGAMGYYLYPLSCDSADTDDENTLEELNLV